MFSLSLLIFLTWTQQRPIMINLALSPPLRGTPPLKTYLPNQITLKLSTYFKSRVPRWDLFFSKKNFQNRAFFGIYGPKRADVSTFFRYTLRKNRLTYDLEILTQAKYHKYGGIYKRKF